MWKYYNPNPLNKNTGDCAVRAISKALNISWDKAKTYLDVYSMDEAEVETSDIVWGKILHEHGFKMETVLCESCNNNLEDFCRTHPTGTYVVKLPNHVVCAKDGCYYDSWDSGKEIVIYCWRKN
jgi:hypothetical protein